MTRMSLSSTPWFIASLWIAFTLVAPTCKAAEWVKIYETPGMTIFADVGTMLAAKESRVARVLMNFNDFSDDDLASTITVEKFDCEKQLRQSLSGEHFDQNMGRGKPTFAYTEPTRWKKVTSRDGWHPVFKLICGYDIPTD